MHTKRFPRFRAGRMLAPALAWAICGWAMCGPAAVPAADPGHPVDPSAARAEFDAAAEAMKRIVGDLTVLQAKYQQPKADKPAIEAKFDALKVDAQAASERLEKAAFALAAADPKHAEARQISGAMLAGALRSDDPLVVLAKAAVLEKAGAADAAICGMAASAALVLSRLDEAAAWLKKAGAGDREQLADIEAAIDRDRPKVTEEMARREAEARADDLPRVRITTSAGELVVELFENEAPNTVANFVALVDKGFYDGTPFHRVIGGFMAQGGDPTGSGRGGPGHAIPCECDVPGARKHFYGSLSMAHAGRDTGGSQFFLTFRPTEHLDGRHTVFGRVIDGFDVLPKLVRTQDEQGRPVAGVRPDKIVKAEVLRKRGHPYEPRTLPDPRK